MWFVGYLWFIYLAVVGVWNHSVVVVVWIPLVVVVVWKALSVVVWIPLVVGEECVEDIVEDDVGRGHGNPLPAVVLFSKGLSHEKGHFVPFAFFKQKCLIAAAK